MRFFDRSDLAVALWVGVAVGLAGFLLGTTAEHRIATPFAATSIQLGSGTPATLLSVRAGSPNGVVSGNAGDTIWDTSTPAFWQCQGGTSWTAGTGITGTGVATRVAVWTGASTQTGYAGFTSDSSGNVTTASVTASNLSTTNALVEQNSSGQIVDSNETDDGTTFVTTLGKGRLGSPTQFSATTQYTLVPPTATTTTGWVISPNDTHTAGEEIPFMVFGSAALAYDTTASVGTYWGIDSEATVNHSAGANTLTVAAFHCRAAITNASGADNTECLEGDLGGGQIVIKDGASLGGAKFSSTGAYTATNAEQDLSASTSINLNQFLTATNSANKIEFAGDSSNTPQFTVGVTADNLGTQIQVKNTVSAQDDTGIDVLLDTTVAGGVRGGYRAYVGAGGSAGSAVRFGLVYNPTTSGYCPGDVGGDTCLFGYTGSSNNLQFATDSGTAGANHVAMMLTGGGGHLAHNGIQVSTFSAGCNTPININAVDQGGSFETGSSTSGTCTMTFVHTWTTVPVCMMWIQATTTWIALTTTATTIAFTPANSTTYNYRCECYGGSCT
jgi:hypothetical protein